MRIVTFLGIGIGHLEIRFGNYLGVGNYFGMGTYFGIRIELIKMENFSQPTFLSSQGLADIWSDWQ